MSANGSAEHRPAVRRRRFAHDDLVTVDLFSGFGGLTRGIESASFTTIMAANHNRYKIEVHEANHPTAEHWIADLVDPESDRLSMFDWVVTATNQPDGRVSVFAPPFEWVARIVSQARAAGCRIHLKPNLLGTVGPKSPGMRLPDEYPDPNPVRGGAQ
jgi:hypothetical protein